MKRLTHIECCEHQVRGFGVFSDLPNNCRNEAFVEMDGKKLCQVHAGIYLLAKELEKLDETNAS